MFLYFVLWYCAVLKAHYFVMGCGTVRVIIVINITMEACADACLHIWCAEMHWYIMKNVLCVYLYFTCVIIFLPPTLSIRMYLPPTSNPRPLPHHTCLSFSCLSLCVHVCLLLWFSITTCCSVCCSVLHVYLLYAVLNVLCGICIVMYYVALKTHNLQLISEWLVPGSIASLAGNNRMSS